MKTLATLQSSFQKTRLAPTPSGFLHLGNLFSFALTAALAKRTNAGILLRIDDLDRERVQPAYVQDIFDTLRFMDIPWQHGPVNADEHAQHYSQLHRLPLYKEALGQLKEKGLVYACSCSRTQVLKDSPDGAYAGTCRHKNISLDAPDTSWRLHTATMAPLSVRQIDGSWLNAEWPGDMNDVIVRKKNGDPAYQLASLVDDVYFGVDLVVRGQDLWPSTLVQLHLASLLGFRSFLASTFYHHPLLVQSGKKLSKSAGDTSIRHLRERYSSKEIYALLGNEPGVDLLLHSWQDLEPLLNTLK